jgi:hypothetical protein
MSTFLDQTELSTLTGRKAKSLQIITLRKMGIPYFVNANGHPIVTRSAIENKKEQLPPKKWTSNILRSS